MFRYCDFILLNFCLTPYLFTAMQKYIRKRMKHSGM